MNITVNYKSEIINSIKEVFIINEIFDKEKLNILLNDKNIENNINFRNFIFLSVLDKKYNLDLKSRYLLILSNDYKSFILIIIGQK